MKIAQTKMFLFLYCGKKCEGHQISPKMTTKTKVPWPSHNSLKAVFGYLRLVCVLVSFVGFELFFEFVSLTVSRTVMSSLIFFFSLGVSRCQKRLLGERTFLLKGAGRQKKKKCGNSLVLHSRSDRNKCHQQFSEFCLFP